MSCLDVSDRMGRLTRCFKEKTGIASGVPAPGLSGYDEKRVARSGRQPGYVAVAVDRRVGGSALCGEPERVHAVDPATMLCARRSWNESHHGVHQCSHDSSWGSDDYEQGFWQNGCHDSGAKVYCCCCCCCDGGRTSSPFMVVDRAASLFSFVVPRGAIVVVVWTRTTHTHVTPLIMIDWWHVRGWRSTRTTRGYRTAAGRVTHSQCERR